MRGHRTLSHIVAGLLALCWWMAEPVWALEFTADQIVKSNGRTRKTVMYYRDNMWRLEHHDLGPVNVTIVRKDKQLMWLLLSRMKHFKTVPYDPAMAPKIAEKLEGETGREEIGTEVFDGHPTILYEVTTQTAEGTEQYYQWLATDLRFPVKLAKKDASWIIEYRHLKMRAVSDYLFQLPVNFQPLESYDQQPAESKPEQQLESKPRM